MTLEELHAQLGAYYRQHAPTIDTHIMQGYDSRNTYRPISDVVDQYVSKTKHLEKILQPHMRGFTPHSNKLRFTPEIHQIGRFKINYEITSDDIVELEQSAMGYLLQGTNFNPAQQARSVSQMVVNSIMDRADEELEMEVHYKGVKQEPTYPNPGEPGDGVNGSEKVVDDAITEGKLPEIALGDYNDSEFFDYAEAFVGELPDRVKRRPLQIECSMQNIENYWENRRFKFNTATDYDPDKPLYIKNYKNITLKGIPGMRSSKRIICTVPGNKISLHGGKAEMGSLKFTLKEDEQVLRISGFFKLGFGYSSFGVRGATRLDDYLVFVNDVA